MEFKVCLIEVGLYIFYLCKGLQKRNNMNIIKSLKNPTDEKSSSSVI